jgi:hypothetical protein
LISETIIWDSFLNLPAFIHAFRRIGDSPIVGAGTYANSSTCAVSCTGWGEFFIRGVVAYDVSAMMEYSGATLDNAAKHIIHKSFPAKLGPSASGGLIGVDGKGNVTMPFNSSGMYRGYVQNDGRCFVGIWDEIVDMGHVDDNDSTTDQEGGSDSLDKKAQADENFTVSYFYSV